MKVAIGNCIGHGEDNYILENAIGFKLDIVEPLDEVSKVLTVLLSQGYNMCWALSHLLIG